MEQRWNSRLLVISILWGAIWVAIAIVLFAHNAVSWQRSVAVAPFVCLVIGVVGASLGLILAYATRKI